MALVSQDPVLFNRTVRENITYGLRDDQFTEKDIEDVIRLARVDQFLSNLPSVSNKKILKLLINVVVNSRNFRAWIPQLARRACSYRADSVSVSQLLGRSSVSRSCCFSTRPRRRSILKARR